MDESSEHPAPQNVHFARTHFRSDLGLVQTDITRLTARIASTPDINRKRLGEFIKEATRIHESFRVMWMKLQTESEIYSMFVEPTERTSRPLQNLENRLSWLHNRMLGTPYQFPAFPDLSQVERGNRNPPLSKPDQGQASISPRQSEVIQTEDKQRRRRGNSI
jgi:hypothetical protein